MVNRRAFVQNSLLGMGLAVSGVPAGIALGKECIATQKVLEEAGVFKAAKTLGLDADTIFAPLTTEAGKPYARYRWSVGHAPDGGPMINALPPEEELGWTPWERWFRRDGVVCRESWVLFPLKLAAAAKMPRWYRLDEMSSLMPRDMSAPRTLEERFSRNRIDVAAQTLGLNAKNALLAPLTPAARTRYMQYRWTVIPHMLADDMPVIYGLPPVGKSDIWPWESWYTDGKTPLLHHIHYTAKVPPCGDESWRELPGNPQRPPEICGLDWYWYDDVSMTPAMARCM